MRTTVCPFHCAALTVVLMLATTAAGFAQVTISEIRVDNIGSDTEEYFELQGPPGTSLAGLSYLVIGDNTAGGSGVLEKIVNLSGTIPVSGLFVAATASFTLATPDLTASFSFEQGDNVTHLLVSGLTASEGTDLDTDDDGQLDLTPWAAELDRVALIIEENPDDGSPPLSTEYHYGPPTLGPDGFDTPAHATRCAEGWRIAPLRLAGIPNGDTPGASNACCDDLDCFYASVNASTPAALRATLHALVSDHRRYSYDASGDKSWIILEAADEHPGEGMEGMILDVYKNATFIKVTDRGTPGYHREHTWPQSYGFPTNSGTGRYPRSDYHAIFLADSSYNSSRGQLPYDTCDVPECDARPTVANNGQGGDLPPPLYPGDSNWRIESEALDRHAWETWTGAKGGRRGDVARAVLYMDLRYDGTSHVDGSPEPNLILVDDPSQITSTGADATAGHMGILSTLLEWNRSEPVDSVESLHHEMVAFFQQNRNPFVDHPEWADFLHNGIFADGFESGDMSVWSKSVP